jgi:hypothetical protein
MAKGTVKSQSDIEGYITAAREAVDAKAHGNNITEAMYQRTLKNESGAPVRGIWTDPGPNKAGAVGMSQMFSKAIIDAHELLYGKLLAEGSEELAKVKAKIEADPKTAILYGYAATVKFEQAVKAYLRKQGIVVNDPSAIRSMAAAAYHLGMLPSKRNGMSGVQKCIDEASPNKKFDITKFVEAYERASGGIKEKSPRAREEAGIGGSVGGGPQAAQGTVKSVSPTEAESATYKPLAFSVDAAVPLVPIKVIEKGLDNAAWFSKDPTSGGGLVGNPHLVQVSNPAWFELRLNKVDGTSLSDPNGNPLKIRLVTSLQSVNTKSEHIVNRTETATGLLITFWGSQPDSIVGRGKTGLFLNTFGLTSYMSSMGSLDANGLYDHLGSVFQESPKTWAKILQEKEKLRVAAQDAFMEFTALFKNNGITRFMPPEVSADDKNDKVWSPSAGASGFQMKSRAGDTYTRGYVAFKYKGQTYLGYFKSMEFTADAKTPFQWDFTFNFRVLRSLTPVFKYKVT